MEVCRSNCVWRNRLRKAPVDGDSGAQGEAKNVKAGTGSKGEEQEPALEGSSPGGVEELKLSMREFSNYFEQSVST